MGDVVGLVLREDRVDCAVVRRRLGRARVLGAFSVAADEEVGAALRARLRELGARARHAHVGFPRRRAVVKTIELPAVGGADLRRMVRFELERHLPFPADEALFDFHVLARPPGQPVRVLLVAAERRVFDRVGELLRGAGLVPRLLDVTIHSLALLAPPAAGAARGEGRLLLRLEDGDAELAVVRDGRPILSRAIPVPEDGPARGTVLAAELRRTLGSLGPADREAVAEVTVTGPGPLPATDWAELPLHTGATLPTGLGADVPSPLLPALAMALRRPGRGPVGTNLLPEEARPRPFPWPRVLTAALAGLVLLLALAVPAVETWRDQRRLAALDRAIARLAPDVRQVEQAVAAIERARRELDTLRAFEARHVRVLPVLRELTELLPPDVWLTNLSVDGKGLELAGFAASASQLIPLLEASPLLERVEFTSPVTKGRDREQFRLKAGWERGPGSGSVPAPAPAVPAPRPPGPAPRA